MKNVIRMGDPTSHGGTVVSGRSNTDVFGKPLACVGDAITCPKHGPGVIVDGDLTWTINGNAVALHGHHGSCGCTLISTISNVWVDENGGRGRSARNAANSDSTGKAALEDVSKKFNQHFQFVDEVTGEPIKNKNYRILFNGQTIEGATDENGLTRLVWHDSADEIRIFY